MSNSFINKLKSRVSCRSYSDKKVSLGKINEIIDAGKSAPSAVNRQIGAITCVRRKNVLESLRKLSNDTLNRDVMYGANTIMLVHAPREDKFCVQDCSCILENIFLAATALKIDSCWINQFDDLLSTDAGLKIKKKLGIPMENRIVGSAILGYRKDGESLAVKSKEGIKVTII